MAEVRGIMLLIGIAMVVLALIPACTDVRAVMDYGVCSVRHQGCGQ